MEGEEEQDLLGESGRGLSSSKVTTPEGLGGTSEATTRGRELWCIVELPLAEEQEEELTSESEEEQQELSTSEATTRGGPVGSSEVTMREGESSSEEVGEEGSDGGEEGQGD